MILGGLRFRASGVRLKSSFNCFCKGSFTCSLYKGSYDSIGRGLRFRALRFL